MRLPERRPWALFDLVLVLTGWRWGRSSPCSGLGRAGMALCTARPGMAGRLTPGGVGGRAGRVSGECGAEPAEAFGNLGSPPPGAVDAQAGAAGGAGELSGRMQDPVAQSGDLAAG